MNKITLAVFAGLISFETLCQPKLEINQLTKDVYVFTTYQKFGRVSFPSNGLFLLTTEGAVLIDVAWDSTQLQPLLDTIKIHHNKDVIMSISTHSHEDRTRGIEELKKRGVKTYASHKTKELCIANGEEVPEFSFKKDTTFNVGGYSFQAVFPGEGHTVDNIVVWLEDDRILYGGCLVKSYEATNMGYTGEANLDQWAFSIKRLQKDFAYAKQVIPGHQDWKSDQSLTRTLELLKQHFEN